MTGQADTESFFDPAGKVRPGWTTALGSAACAVVGPSVLSNMAFGVFAPHLREAFGWTVAQVGYVVAVLAIMVMIASFSGGILIDRFGPRRLILACLPLFGLTLASLSLLNGQLWQLYLIYGLIPLVSIGLWPGSWVKATSGWFEQRLGLAVAVATLGVGIGSTVMPLVINAIAATWGWRAAYASLGLGSIVIAWPIAWAFVHDGQPVGVKRRGRLTDIGPLFAERALWQLIGIFFVLGAFSAITLSHLVSVLEAQGIPRGTAVAVQSMTGLSTVLGRLICGWLLDRYSIRLIGPVFAIPAAIAVYVVSLGVDSVGAFVCAGVIGLLVGAEIDVLGYAVKRFFGLGNYGTIYGLVFACFSIGSASGAASLGALYSASGRYAPGLLLAAVSAAIAGVLFAFLPPYRNASSVQPAQLSPA